MGAGGKDSGEQEAKTEHQAAGILSREIGIHPLAPQQLRSGKHVRIGLPDKIDGDVLQPMDALCRLSRRVVNVSRTVGEIGRPSRVPLVRYPGIPGERFQGGSFARSDQCGIGEVPIISNALAPKNPTVKPTAFRQVEKAGQIQAATGIRKNVLTCWLETKPSDKSGNLPLSSVAIVAQPTDEVGGDRTRLTKGQQFRIDCHIGILNRRRNYPAIIEEVTGVAHLSLSSPDRCDIAYDVQRVGKSGSVGEGGPSLTDNQSFILSEGMSQSEGVATAEKVSLHHDAKWIPGVGDPPRIHIQTRLPRMHPCVGALRITDRYGGWVKGVGRVDGTEVPEQIGFHIAAKFERPPAFLQRQSIDIILRELVEVQPDTEGIGFRKSSPRQL